jgi:hypothetical protein
VLAARFFAASESMRNEINQDHFRFRRAAFHSQLKFKVGNILARATALRINFSIGRAPVS